jgi:hypothetical protein
MAILSEITPKVKSKHGVSHVSYTTRQMVQIGHWLGDFLSYPQGLSTDTPILAGIPMSIHMTQITLPFYAQVIHMTYITRHNVRFVLLTGE